MAHRTTLVAVLLATACFANGTAWAADDAAPLEEIIVTGTQDKTTTDLKSMAPVNVVTAVQLRDTGFTDLARSLETTEPELNFPRPTAQPTVSSTRPFTLNGLYPDEGLVLVDGKRWHASAVLDTNVGLGRGTASVDLSTIPLSAIDHVEVLRDGASAQYGSDAISGVVNIILKSNNSDGIANAQAGVTERGDGVNGLISVNHGFALGDGGFLSLTAEGNANDWTDRAAIDQRYDRYTWRLGDPAAASFNFGVNASYPIAGIGALYGNLFLSRKGSTDTPVFEPPGYSPIWPDGFNPRDQLILWDINGTAGMRGDLTDTITYDLSNTYGRSSADFYSFDGANQSLGLASPTSFYAGTPIYQQDVTDLAFNRPLPEFLSGGNLAVGAQYRYEHYQIESGDAASYAGAGAASLPGFNPRIPVNNSREAVAVYIDLELRPLDWLTLDGAGRYDHYSDFGGAPTYKFSGRAQANGWLAFRGTVGTGFRAPSMQQEYYNTVSTTATGVNKALVNVGTFQVDDPVSKALGATPLQPEKSQDYFLGAVVTPEPGLSLTAGVFRIDIDHRIALTDSQSGAAVLAALNAAGITNVQQVAFFTNGINTRTNGANLSASYKGEFDPDTPFTLSIGWERNFTRSRGLAGDPAAPSLTLLSYHSQLLLTEAQPADKTTAAFTVSHGRYSGTVDATRYGGYEDIPISPVQYFSANTVVNLSASAELFDGGTLTLGVLNVGDEFPDKLAGTQAAYATFGGTYSYGVESPDGTDGRAYYARFSIRF